MEVFCVKVEYESFYPLDNYTAHTLWSTLKGAKRAFKQERDDILKQAGWSEDNIEIDKDDYFLAMINGYDSESYTITISKESVHE